MLVNHSRCCKTASLPPCPDGGPGWGYVLLPKYTRSHYSPKLEAENSEIVDIVRGMSISLTELPLLFEKLKDGGTLGQSVPKSEEEKEEN